MHRIPLLLLTAALLAGGCAQRSDRDPADVLGQPADVGGPIAPGTGLDEAAAPTSAEVVEAALADVEDFWRRVYPQVYGDAYAPIVGGFWPYGPGTDQPPCGDPIPVYDEIAENAFYCPGDDLIAWDEVALVEPLYEEFGGFTLGIVFAHEFGHAIQERADVRGPTILTELQADCFAGAWTGDVEAGNAEHFELGLRDLDKAMAGFLELRDTVGVGADDPAAHGTGFDRIGAFIEGYEQGVERCADYPELLRSGELVIVEVPFTDEEDFQRGGNLPLSELRAALFPDLENFWTVLFAELGTTWDPVDEVVAIDPAADRVRCGSQVLQGDDLLGAAFYCEPADTIFYDAVELVPALNEIGDYAVATELARQYAYAAQARLGTGVAADDDLQADCLAGLYAYSGYSGNRDGQGQELFLSPGDLDEAIIAFLYDSESSSALGATHADSVGSAFARVDAFRDGFLGGVDACMAG